MNLLVIIASGHPASDALVDGMFVLIVGHLDMDPALCAFGSAALAANDAEVTA